MARLWQARVPVVASNASQTPRHRLSAPPLDEPVIGDIIANGLIPTPPARGKQGCGNRWPLIGSLSGLARNQQDPVDLFPSTTPAWRNAEGGSLC
ncbi:hypothetical protein BM1_10342 [Bipolaris maydis]|nr:hypothetical protein BM1_10342 [Bipolaris maydis]